MAKRPSSPAPARVVISNVAPVVDDGRYPAKAVAGDPVVVEADIFLEGHDELAAVLHYRPQGEAPWQGIGMMQTGGDRHQAAFTPPDAGSYEFRIEAWPDPFATWRRDLALRVEAGQDIAAELPAGIEMIGSAAARAPEPDAKRLLESAAALNEEEPSLWAGVALDPVLATLMAAYPDRTGSTLLDRSYPLYAERSRAANGAWYEMFPRSASPDPSRPGRLADVITRLPYVASMGFDVLYLPPVHPIGMAYRKGRNNSVTSGPGEPGSPWAIGSAAGGHKAIDPDLGTLADFRDLVARAAAAGIEIAMDLAFQCSPDHPYVKDHPDWFRHRPDGSVRYAENPPKKYQDIYPLDFQCPDWRNLWDELKSVVDFWMEQGVRIFRVDNPHTKPFAFWEWLIAEVRREEPGVVFLAEAFTREAVMFHLAKIGFSQSYTYFTWRNTKAEIESYFNQLSLRPVSDFFRPNLWPNTPDILHAFLQYGGRPAFLIRFILAATLGASYGIYGPAFELGEREPLEPGSEEYRDSDKYEVRHWDVDRPDSLRHVIAIVNDIRRKNAALQSGARLRFHSIDNPNLIAYSKTSPEGETMLFIVNLNPYGTETGWLDFPILDFDIAAGEPYQVDDLLRDERYTWYDWRNYIRLDPGVMPAHLFRLKRRRVDDSGAETFV